MIFRLGSTNLLSRHYLPLPTNPIPVLIRIPIPNRIRVPHTPLPLLLIPNTYTNRTLSPSPPLRHLLILKPPIPTLTHMTNHQHTIPRVSTLPKPLLPSASQLPLDHLLYLLLLALHLLRLLHHHHHRHHHHHHYHHHHLTIQFVRGVCRVHLLG